MIDDDKVTMRYEGKYNGHNSDDLVCIVTYKGTEYKFLYRNLRIIPQLYGVPYAVREYLLHWGMMLHNPD